MILDHNINATSISISSKDADSVDASRLQDPWENYVGAKRLPIEISLRFETFSIETVGFYALMQLFRQLH